MSIGDYDHLNKCAPLTVKLDFPNLVSNIIGLNYGVHRFLSELVRQRKEIASRCKRVDRFINVIERELEDGSC